VLRLSDQAFVSSLATFAVLAAILLVVRTVVLRQLKAVAKRTQTTWDDVVFDLIGRVKAVELGLFAFYVATRGVSFPIFIHRSLRILVVLTVVHRLVRILQGLAFHLIERFEAGAGADAARQAAAKNAMYVTNAFIWVVAALFALANIGVNISAMLAGLGIGGIAVALGAQAVLADLFSAVAIFLDKPFVIGDAIAVDSFVGTVERIGFKTTRVRSISGEIIVFPNSALTSAKIRNYRQLWERRVVIGFKIPFQTDLTQVRKVPQIIKEIIQKTERVRLDRSHFKGFGDSSLEYEAVFYVLDSDYNRAMDISEHVHFEILEAFQRSNVRFATPTHTLIHEGGRGAV
jgi:small-conductance mechanosensitive channel